MRTKTLLVAAAISAVGLTASLAQSVYSVNVVGYVNVPVVVGYNAIANPLDASPNNALNSVLPAVTDGSVILTWDPVAQGFGAPQQFYEGYGWADQDFNLSTNTVQPGEGFFFSSPVSTNLTFVGDVRQGALSEPLYLGYNCISQLTPQSGSIMDFGFPAVDGDVYLPFDTATQQYGAPIQYYDGYGWADQNFTLTPPNINVGSAVMLSKVGPTTWNFTFNVQ